MIYKVLIFLTLLAYALYSIVCFLEVFGIMKWTDKKTTITYPKALIPFYYLIKNKNND